MLTDVAIKTLKPRDLCYYVTDGHGLAIEVFPSGSMAWRYRYSLNGRPEKIALGRYPQINLKTARQKRDEMAVLVTQGISPAKQKQAERSGLSEHTTMREFGERYFRECLEKNLKDPSHLRRYLNKEIFPALGNRPLREITALDVQTIVFRKRDHGFPAAAAQIRNLVKRIFDYAVVCQLVQTNPAMATPMRFITNSCSSWLFAEGYLNRSLVSHRMRNWKSPKLSGFAAAEASRSIQRMVGFSVPENWGWVPLGTAMDMANGKAFKPEEWSSEGTPIIRIQNHNNENAYFNRCSADLDPKIHVHDGDFLISWSGTFAIA